MKPALALVFLASAAHADIVGGTDVKPADPIRESIAALYEPSGGSLCTASIIGPHTAVTAAHCVRQGGPKPVLIFGNDVRAKDRALRPVTDIAIHPRWKDSRGAGMDQGDIALVKFRGGLPGQYHPVPRMSSERALKKGRSVTLAGYGISDARRKSGAGRLRKTSVKVSGARPGKSEMILDQSAGHGACHGDSGGPAYIRQGGKTVLAGVTNRGYPNSAPDDCRHKVVYTKVSAYEPWINATEKKFEKNSAAQAMRAAKSRIGRRLPMGAKALAKLKRKLATTSRRAATASARIPSRPASTTTRTSRR